jgi:hypothetical protein
VDVPRYRFGPLERRGVLGGLRASQVAILGGALLLGLLSLRLVEGGAGIPAAIAIVGGGAIVTFLSVAGRPLTEWIPVVARWKVVRFTGTHRFASRSPVEGMGQRLRPQPSLPEPLSRTTILSHAVPGSSGAMGVLKDDREGTYTAVLKLRGQSFSLLDPEEKARRLAAWGATLAGLARERGLVHRVQWIERTSPDPSDEVARHLRDHAVLPLDSPIVRSYLEVLDDATPVSHQHEVLVALQVSASRAGRAVKTAGGGDAGACEVLRREITSLSSSLMSADVNVEGVLTPRLLAGVIRTTFDPSSRAHLARIGARDSEREGSSPSAAGPMTTEASWTVFRADRALHATYWIAEWPRVDVDPDFLAALLLRTECTRAVSLVMEPIPPLRAIRSVESARTSIAADDELRERAGFLTTARRRREDDALAQHERELGDGHAFFRFAGFITVTAHSAEDLEAAGGEIEEAAGRALLDVRRLDGQHDVAFAYTLPTCRGLA